MGMAVLIQLLQYLSIVNQEKWKWKFVDLKKKLFKSVYAFVCNSDRGQITEWKFVPMEPRGPMGPNTKGDFKTIFSQLLFAKM